MRNINFIYQHSNKTLHFIFIRNLEIKEISTDAKMNQIDKVIRSEGSKYSCNQCDKQYTQSSHLKRHIKDAHEGVKFSCKQCDKQYSDQSRLRYHIQSTHEGVKYACNQCDYQAKSS